MQASYSFLHFFQKVKKTDVIEWDYFLKDRLAEKVDKGRGQDLVSFSLKSVIFSVGPPGISFPPPSFIKIYYPILIPFLFLFPCPILQVLAPVARWISSRRFTVTRTFPRAISSEKHHATQVPTRKSSKRYKGKERNGVERTSMKE